MTHRTIIFNLKFGAICQWSTVKWYPVWYLRVEYFSHLSYRHAFDHIKLAKCVNNKLANTGTINPFIQIQQNFHV